MDERALTRLHGLEPKSFLVICFGKDSKFAFLLLCPFGMLLKQGQRFRRVRDVITSINMTGTVDVQCKSQFPVALQPRAFFIAGQRLRKIALAGFGGIALDLLFLRLTRTGDEYLVGTRLILFACEGRMALILVGMTADGLRLATRLLTCACSGILAFTRAMTRLLTEVRPTFQFLATDLSTAGIL